MKTADELRQDIAFEATLCGNRMRLRSTWGLFSPRGIDDGSRLLIEHLDIEDNGVSLDLGCGYGAIGLAIAKSTPNGTVHMVDKDFVALEYARRNAELNCIANVEIYPSNGFGSVQRSARFDNVVSNLPAKVGKELFYIFLCDARDHLKDGGQLVVVTIAGLKEFIKRNFKEVFGNYKKIKQGRSHIVARAVKENC